MTPAEPTARRPDDSRGTALLRRVAIEFDEWPGLRLTAAQAQRLFAVPGEACIRVLETLVEQQVLVRDTSGRYHLAQPRNRVRE
jgi:hypothetical protein